MSLISDAAAELEAALRTVSGLRVYTDPGAVIDPPGAVLGPPSLAWETPCADPTSATFLVVVVVSADDRAMPRLWELTPLVAAAVDQVRGAVVLRAAPGSWATNTPLPCYEISVEVSL